MLVTQTDDDDDDDVSQSDPLVMAPCEAAPVSMAWTCAVEASGGAGPSS